MERYFKITRKTGVNALYHYDYECGAPFKTLILKANTYDQAVTHSTAYIQQNGVWLGLNSYDIVEVDKDELIFSHDVLCTDIYRDPLRKNKRIIVLEN